MPSWPQNVLSAALFLVLQRTFFLPDYCCRRCLCCKSGVEFEQFYLELERGANYKSVISTVTIIQLHYKTLYSSYVGGSVMLMMICM